ncbi:MAG: hypothetical protein AAF125_03785, partial [Chloroflexota bacterium]
MKKANLTHLQTSLARIDDYIRAAVERAQSASQGPTDALRGLVVSDDEVNLLMQQVPLRGLWEEGTSLRLALNLPDKADPDYPFINLVEAFGLSILDAHLLLFCLAPELDRRYERVYAYLQDDMSQRRVTVNLLMNLLGGDLSERFKVWERLQPESPLIQYRLVSVVPNSDKPNAASLSHTVKVDQRVVGHLLGLDIPDDRIRHAVKQAPMDEVVAVTDDVFERLQDAMADAPIYYMQGKADTGQASTAAALCRPYDVALVRINGVGLRIPDMPFDELWRLAIREGLLQQAALMIENWEKLLGDDTQPNSEFWAAVMA